MKEPLYREVLNRARHDLAAGIRERSRLLLLLESTERDIAQLKRLIGGVHAYVDESDQNDVLSQTGEGLKEAICTALRAASQDVTISEILGILKELQFPIEAHQNPLGSIYTTVTRLVADGDVVPGEPRGDKKTYRWAGLMIQSAGKSRQVIASSIADLVADLAKATKKS